MNALLTLFSTPPVFQFTTSGITSNRTTRQDVHLHGRRVKRSAAFTTAAQTLWPPTACKAPRRIPVVQDDAVLLAPHARPQLLNFDARRAFLSSHSSTSIAAHLPQQLPQ